MFVLIFRFAGEASEKTIICGSMSEVLAEKQRIRTTPGKFVVFCDLLLENDEVCETLGVMVETRSIRRGKVEWQ